jgi:hypothetical protein
MYEALVHINGHTNCHNCHTWGEQQPDEVLSACITLQKWTYDADFCITVVALFIFIFLMFAELTIKGDVYLKMLELFFFPTLWGQGR